MTTKTDSPFYNDQPVAISLLGWLAVVASVAAAYALLVTLPLRGFPLGIITAVAYTGLPLLTLALVTRGHHTALFRRVGIKEIALMFGFGLLCTVLSMGVALVLTQITEMTANTAGSSLSSAGPAEYATFMLLTAIQLLGEEVMTILPLLAVLWLCVRKFNLSRTVGLVIAVIVSTAWFAAVHLPTYNWNFLQCFGGIGAARLVLTAAFLATRNLWVSAGAHIINDWTEFFLAAAAIGGHTPINPAA
jgi:membrane protease YdiL (CAAX protease family)